MQAWTINGTMVCEGDLVKLTIDREPWRHTTQGALLDMPAEVLVKCSLTRGGFSGERVFRFIGRAGEYTGVAPVHYCHALDRTPLTENQPLSGQKINGLVAARVVREDQSGAVLLWLPDGGVVWADQGLIVPTEEAADVPVQS